MVVMANNIKLIRKERGLTQEKLAALCGTTKATIMKLEKGPEQGGMQLKQEWMEKLSRALGVSFSELTGEITKKVKVLGFVGAGEAVTIFDDHAQGAALDEIDPPVGYSADGIVAVRVRGESMEPQLEHGWTIFYRKQADGVAPDCIGELCVVKLIDGSMLVKKLRQGSAKNLFHLLSKNPLHQPMFDQKLLWAARVIDIRPR